MTTTHNADAFTAVNATDAHFTRRRYLFAFGAYGATRLLVWSNSLDDALDIATDYLATHAPGLLADDAVADEYQRAMAEGLDEQRAMAFAEVDTTACGDGHYLHSWEWTVVAVDPSRAFLLGLQGRSAERRKRECVRTFARETGPRCLRLCACCNGRGVESTACDDSECECGGLVDCAACEGLCVLFDDLATHYSDQTCRATSCAHSDETRLTIDGGASRRVACAHGVSL